jgi:hypothetical protein
MAATTGAVVVGATDVVLASGRVVVVVGRVVDLAVVGELTVGSPPAWEQAVRPMATTPARTRKRAGRRDVMTRSG